MLCLRAQLISDVEVEASGWWVVEQEQELAPWVWGLGEFEEGGAEGELL